MISSLILWCCHVRNTCLALGECEDNLIVQEGLSNGGTVMRLSDEKGSLKYAFYTDVRRKGSIYISYCWVITKSGELFRRQAEKGLIELIIHGLT